MRRASRPVEQRGISIVELLITVAIFTILTLMALPMFTTWLASQQVRTATEAVLDGLRAAQSEAIKRNQPVRFVLTPSTGWEAQLVSDDSVVRKALFAEGALKVNFVATPLGTTTVAFDGLGRVLDKDLDPLAARVTWEIDSSVATGARKLRVVLDTAAATGHAIKSCDPALVGDPRSCP